MNFALWALGRDRLTRRLGLLCMAYALRMSYPFLRTLGVPAIRSLYAVEDFCAAAVLLCAILLAGELSGAARLGFQRRAAVPAAAAMCAVCVIFRFLSYHMRRFLSTAMVCCFLYGRYWPAFISSSSPPGR